MKVLADAMVPGGKVKIDAGGEGPNGEVPPKITAIEKWLPILLDGLKQFNLSDTDMVLMAIACARTETGNFVPKNEPLYSLNTTGTFRDAATGNVDYVSTMANVHNTKSNPHGYDTLLAHKNMVHNHTETFTPDADKGNVYYGRGGNTHPGDGWKYRGRGLIQLTFHDNYKQAGIYAGVGNKFIDDPDLVNTEQWAGIVVAAYLAHGEHNIRTALQAGDLKAARIAVNGGRTACPSLERRWLRDEELSQKP